MGRRSAGNPHPEDIGGTYSETGLPWGSKKEVRSAVEGLSIMHDLPGWDRYTWDMKRFLVVLPVVRQRNRAAAVIGRDREWLDAMAERYGSTWRRAIEARLAHGSVAADIPAFTQDLWAIAVLRLEEKLFSDNEQVVLKSVELLGKIQGILPARKGDRPSGREQQVEPFRFETRLKKQFEDEDGDPVASMNDPAEEDGHDRNGASLTEDGGWEALESLAATPDKR